MHKYMTFEGADREKPGTGFERESFKASDDVEAMELAKRHFQGTGHTVWAHDGVDKLGHIQYRFIDYIDGPPKGKKHGDHQASG